MTKGNESSPPPLSDAHEIGPLFLANFVHQIVNPLNGVIGTLDNIADGTYKGLVANQKINVCRAQLEQCVSLARNLAYISDYFFEKSARESLKVARPSGVSVLPQVIIEAIQFFQVAASLKRIRIELIDPQTQYRVSIRPELLRQVFMNLFDNWVKYGLNDQTVRICPAVNKFGHLVIEVSGASIGFSSVDAGRLFELAFRSDAAEKKVAQGSGIGLYVCRQIIEKNLGGTISAVHSKASGVSTFRIDIPETKWQL